MTATMRGIASRGVQGLIHLSRLGLDRFARGFAGEEYLSVYLVFLLLHVWLVIGLGAAGEVGETQRSR